MEPRVGNHEFVKEKHTQGDYARKANNPLQRSSGRSMQAFVYVSISSTSGCKHSRVYSIAHIVETYFLSYPGPYPMPTALLTELPLVGNWVRSDKRVIYQQPRQPSRDCDREIAKRSVSFS